MIDQNKLEQLKKLFYSNYTSIDLQRKLNLSNNEYQKLLVEAKKELGLPSNYKRKPHRYGKYVKNSYFIKKYTEGDDFEIITYAPTLEDAEEKLRLFDDGISVYAIEQATDEHMKELIQKDYFENNMLWSDMLKKYQIPYMKFYSLLNEIKQKLGLENIRTVKNGRYVYRHKKSNSYIVKKNIDGKTENFGYYKEYDVAVHVRDYLEDISWNRTKWLSEKEKVVKEAENGC